MSQNRPVNEDVLSCTEDVQVLLDGDVSTLDESESTKLTLRLLSQLGTVNVLERSGNLEKSKAHQMQDWLNAKLREIATGSPRRKSSALVTESVETQKQQSAAQRVIASFQTRLNKAVQEISTLKEQVETIPSLQQEIESHKARVAKVTEELALANETKARLSERLAQVGQELAESEKKLSLAQEYIAKASERQVADPVAEAVDAAIEVNPQLVKFRRIMEQSESVEELTALVEQMHNGGNGASSRPSGRRPMPVGNVVSESRGLERREVPASNGASIAAKVVGRMNSNQPSARPLG